MLHEKLTESDVKKIQEEIEHRKLVIRKEALESVKEARAHGARNSVRCNAYDRPKHCS